MTSKSEVLTKALLKAATIMGISISDLQRIVGVDFADIDFPDIKPDSKHGELALIFIDCYKCLYMLVGGSQENIRHWLSTYNRSTQGIPVEQIAQVSGLVHVADYLHAMTNK